MNRPANPRSPFYIVLGTVLVLATLSQFKSEIDIGGFSTKSINIFSEIQAKEIPKKIPDTLNLAADSLKDTATIVEVEDSMGIYDFSKGDIGAMERFFSALAKAKAENGKVRVAYFGDSMIEGDLMTQDLRDTLQKLFCGRGVGFVPITSIVAGFRKTITHSFSDSWNSWNLTDAVNKQHPLGLSGYSYSASSGNKVTYKATKYSYLLNSFDHVKLYYGRTDSSAKLKVALDDSLVEMPMYGENAVNELLLNNSQRVNSVSLNFHCPDSVNIFGASFESNVGVYVDNYSFRGNSGLALTKIPPSVFRGFDKYFNYDLIVLHYGLNVVSHAAKDYSWYERGLDKLLDYMRNVYPNASILVVSVNDKSWHSPDGWQTEPNIPVLVDIQKKAAEKKGVAFWNLYLAMGGENSMVHWVEGDTTLANKDYTHPNYKGARKISNLLIQALMKKYEAYEKKNKI